MWRIEYGDNYAKTPVFARLFREFDVVMIAVLLRTINNSGAALRGKTYGHVTPSDPPRQRLTKRDIEGPQLARARWSCT